LSDRVPQGRLNVTRYANGKSALASILLESALATRSVSLTEHQRERFLEGIALFNRGEFFDCHEALEEVWLELSGERKKFLQGLIQVAVALHHLRNGNRVGAGRLLAAAVEKLAGDSPEREIIDVDALLADLAPLRQHLGTGEACNEPTTPQIYWKEPPNEVSSES